MITPTRALLLSLLPVEIRPGYIDSDEGQPNPLHVYCREHAYEVARRRGAERGVEAYVCGAWGGGDNVERCAITTCEVDLDCGGLTSYGVDSALALTEEDPFACDVTPAELSLAADAMLHNDPRWALWDYHALAAVARRRRVPLVPGSMSLHEVLARLNYTTLPGSGIPHPGKKILRDGEVVHEGTADSTWKWLRQTGQIA